MLVHIIVNWVVGAVALWIVSRVVPGIQLRDFGSALFATIMIAIVNAVLGPVFKFVTFPLIILTLGLFWLVINGVLLLLASVFTPGFKIGGFLPAIVGSLVLTVLTWLLRKVVFV